MQDCTFSSGIFNLNGIFKGLDRALRLNPEEGKSTYLGYPYKVFQEAQFLLCYPPLLGVNGKLLHLLSLFRMQFAFPFMGISFPGMVVESLSLEVFKNRFGQHFSGIV